MQLLIRSEESCLELHAWRGSKKTSAGWSIPERISAFGGVKVRHGGGDDVGFNEVMLWSYRCWLVEA